MAKKENQDELFAIVFTETGELLSPSSFKKYWPKYGENGLYGWRPPKKIYFTLGQARAGFSHIPDALKEKVSIRRFVGAGDVILGKHLKELQRKR